MKISCASDSSWSGFLNNAYMYVLLSFNLSSFANIFFCLYASSDRQPHSRPAWDEFFFFLIRTYCCKIHTCIGNSDTKAQSLAPRLFVYLHPDNWSIFSRKFWEKDQKGMSDLVTLQSALLTRFHHTGGTMLHNRQSPSMAFLSRFLGFYCGWWRLLPNQGVFLCLFLWQDEEHDRSLRMDRYSSWTALSYSAPNIYNLRGGCMSGCHEDSPTKTRSNRSYSLSPTRPPCDLLIESRSTMVILLQSSRFTFFKFGSGHWYNGWGLVRYMIFCMCA